MPKQQTDRQWEEKYLEQTLQVVADNIENYTRETERMQADIDEMLEHYHDNDTEVWIILNNTITLNNHMKAALERNLRAREKPYFGRIIYRDETLGTEESLYIGKGGISADALHQRVTDWRAPVANVYYENGLGHCSYTAPDGSQIDIDLELKRTYDIEEGCLKSYFDTEVVANDDLLMKYLSRNKQAVLSEIVATIQKEQNEIIRKSPYHNLIVQGVAGSGKTTVAMHRISFILYNYAERFRPEDFYIVGSNRILLNYITGVLPDLDVHGVRQMTMEQLFIRLLYEEWDPKIHRVRPVRGDYAETVKGTSRWFSDLADFIRELEWETVNRESVYLDPRQFVEGLKDGKNGVYDRRQEDGAAGRESRLVELVSGAAVERYLRQNPGVSLQSKINMLNERLTVKIQEEFLGKGVKYTQEEKKAILREYRGFYGDREWKQSIYGLYEAFLSRERERGFTVFSPTDGFDVYDLASLALLYKLVKETEVISEAHHIVIDEAQDFGMMVYLTLHACIKDCTYTVMGDVSQNIHFGYGLNDWEELRRLLLPDPMDNFGILKKSYRNTVEISEFATDILRHGSFSVYPVEPIIRHGERVALECLWPRGDFARRAAEICRGWQEKRYDTIAVICRDTESAARAAKELSEHIEIMECDPDKVDFGSGILVLPVEYTKGLEFDAVLILDPSNKDYPKDDGHARLLYVAATRALHELCVLHGRDLTGLIADPAPERSDEPALLPGGEADLPQNIGGSAGANGLLRGGRPSGESGLRPGGRPSGESGLLPGGRQAKKEASGAGEAAARRPAAVLPSAGKDRPGIIVKSAKPQAPSPGGGLIRAYGQGAVPRAAAAGRAPETPRSDADVLRELSSDAFGDMPSTERLRPAGHSKINLGIKWVSRQEDGLYLPSQYGTLRVSPVGSAIVRLTFSKGSRITEGRHPAVAVDRTEKNWRYRDTGRQIELSTQELLLLIDKATGSIQYFSSEKKLLLAERRQECRQLEGDRSWFYLEWQKGEKLLAFESSRAQDMSGLSLRGGARFLKPKAQTPGSQTGLPLIVSDKGYAILPAAEGVCFCCDIPAYGSYLYAENPGGQMDYYFIAGRQTKTLMDAWAYLCGRL